MTSLFSIWIGEELLLPLVRAVICSTKLPGGGPAFRTATVGVIGVTAGVDFSRAATTPGASHEAATSARLAFHQQRVINALALGKLSLCLCEHLIVFRVQRLGAGGGVPFQPRNLGTNGRTDLFNGGGIGGIVLLREEVRAGEPLLLIAQGDRAIQIPRAARLCHGCLKQGHILLFQLFEFRQMHISHVAFERHLPLRIRSADPLLHLGFRRCRGGRGRGSVLRMSDHAESNQHGDQHRAMRFHRGCGGMN